MQNLTIPVCYFPSTVLFVDDSRDFLLNFILQLDEDLAYQVFNSPHKALAMIDDKQCELEQLSERCLTEYTEAEHCPDTNLTVNLNLAAIHSEIYNARRFSEVSVVVVDYAMPGMNGLEFCKKIKNSSIRTILLTGQADEKLAIEAFNEGLIDRYIQKSAANVTELIAKNIQQLQFAYFQTMSNMITKMLAVSSPSCLHDKVFAKYFNQLCEKHHIVEYYLMDNSGSFLMLDRQGNSSSLIVKTEQDLKTHYDLARDNGAPDEILTHLKTGQKIPAFSHANELEDRWNDWFSYLLPAHAVECEQTYYCAFIPSTELFEVRQEKISSYQSYIDKIDEQELIMD